MQGIQDDVVERLAGELHAIQTERQRRTQEALAEIFGGEPESDFLTWESCKEKDEFALDAKRLLAVIKARPVDIEAGWQPIETAPKDGRVVILYRPLASLTDDPTITIRRTSAEPQHCWDVTIPTDCNGKNYTEGACYATHWMPLPEPPAPDASPRKDEADAPASLFSSGTNPPEAA